MRRPTIAATLVAGAALLAAPLAAAAPTGGSATGEASRAVVADARPGGECSVTPVRPMQVSELPRGGSRVGAHVVPLGSIVHVGVQC